MAKSPREESNLSDEEIAHRRDDALLRALSTPPKRHSEMKLGKRKAKTGTKASRPKNTSDG
jgi:hypothetical protein